MNQKLLRIIVLLLMYQPIPMGWGLADDGESLERCERMQEYSERKLVRPSPKERVALIKLLEQKPRPKTLIDADIKYLRSLFDKAVWTGAGSESYRKFGKRSPDKRSTCSGLKFLKANEGSPTFTELRTIPWGL